MYERLTIVIVARIDSEERLNNLMATLVNASQIGCRIKLLEADAESRIDVRKIPEGITYTYVPDYNEVFYRTRYLNQMLEASSTDIVAVWDADILVSVDQIIEAVEMVESGYTIAYPFDGECIMLSPDDSITARGPKGLQWLDTKSFQSKAGRPVCGGIYIVHKSRYMKCGGENEHFTCWGPEDSERARRVEILGHKIGWISKGRIYHLYHNRGKNSAFSDDGAAIRIRREFVRICSMDKDELSQYVNSDLWRPTPVTKDL